MADIPYIQQAQEVKITGQDSGGTTVNFVGADASGNLQVKDAADGPVTPGTVAANSILVGGQFNTALPALTNGQQAAVQVDSSGRPIIAPLTNASVVKAQVEDNAGNGISSVASAGINNLAVCLGATNYALSTVNSTVAQLAAGATFTGAIETVFNQQSSSILLTCDQPGVLTLNQYIDAAGLFLAQTVSFTLVANQGFARSNAINGNYVNLTFKNTGVATTTTLNINTAYGTIPSATQLNNEPVALNEIGGVSIVPYPDGSLPVLPPPKPIFDDTYATSATLDTTNRWNAPVSAGGGVAAAVPVGGGDVALGTGTTANGYSVLTSQYNFNQLAPGFLFLQNAVNLEFPITVNTYRYWGFGVAQSVPTAANPLQDGLGFEVSTAGKMYAVSYSAGTRNVIADLSHATGTSTQPLDSSVHKYFTFYRGDLAYWKIDNTVVATMLTGAPGPINNTLPLAFLAVAGSSAPGSSGVLTVNGTWVGDTSGTSSTISDGTYLWRKATVNTDGSMNQRLLDGKGNAVTSQATGVTTTTVRPLDVSSVSTTVNKYSAALNIIASANTASGTIFSMRNGAAATKDVIIDRIFLSLSNDGAANASVPRYNIVRFSTATPTAGTAITIAKLDSSNPTSQVTDVRFLDTGLTVTSVVFESGNLSNFGITAAANTSQQVDLTMPIRLAAGEGLAIQILAATRTGTSINGHIAWSER